jgi:transposase-like protein
VPILTKCSTCPRSYTVVGQRARKTATWICPRCKRSRNLPRQESPGHVEPQEYDVARELLYARG